MLIDPYQFQTTGIEQIVRQATNAVSVQLTMPNGYTFELGQHAVLRVTMPDGSKLVRQYSFSAPTDTHELWFTIVKEPEGQVSSWFTDMAKAGDAVELSHPFTGSLVQENTRGQICMIAGGSGIAPLIGFVRKLRAEQTSFALLYSTRSNERCYEKELTPLPGEDITVRLTDKAPRFSEPEIVNKLSADSHVFICGSRPFVLAMRSYCETIVPSDQIYSEAFSL